MSRRHGRGKDPAEAGHVQVGLRWRGLAELALIVERTGYGEDEALAVAVQNGLRHWTQALGIRAEEVNARDLLLREAARALHSGPSARVAPESGESVSGYTPR